MTTNSEITVEKLRTFAAETFGNQDMANQWFASHNRLLGMTPNEFIRIGGDLIRIKQILNAIEYGGVV